MCLWTGGWYGLLNLKSTKFPHFPFAFFEMSDPNLNPAASHIPSNDPPVTTTVSGAIPIVEEHATISKTTVETGRVVISKKVEEHQEAVHVVASHDETDVERITLNREVEAAPAVRYEGDTMIIPVVKEVAVVVKKLMLIEEIRVTRRKVQTQETVPVMLRKERLDIVREPSTGAPPQNR